MVGALLVANASLVLSLVRERGISPILIVYLLAIPTNVLTVGVGIAYGLNDALVAALLVAAVLLRFRGHFVFTGALIGLAALIKYYPLLLLPFFALNGRRLHWSVIASGLSIFCVGMTAGFAIWGNSVFHGIGFGMTRHAKLLSILTPLEKLLGDVEVVRWARQYNSLLVVSGVTVAFLWTWKAGRHWLEAAILGYLVMLILYKCGNQQYYLPWLFMLSALPLVNTQSADRMAIIFMPAILLLSVYQFGYEIASHEYRDGFTWVRTYGALVGFALSFASITACMVDYRRLQSLQLTVLRSSVETRLR